MSHVRSRAVGLAVDGSGARLALADGTELEADDVVLATGNGQAPLAWLPDLPGVIRDPWAPGALEDVAPAASVAIVGTGLSAIDVVLSLRDRGHRGPVTMLSSHGLLPEPHLAGVLPARPSAIDPGQRDERTGTRPGAAFGCRGGRGLAPDDRRGAAGHGGELAGTADGRAASRHAPRVPPMGGAPAPDGARRGGRRRGVARR